MASDDSDSQGQAEASHTPRQCMACRGSGKVVSHLGGTVSTVGCPWCRGGGVRVPDLDAQASWLDGDAPDSG